MQRPKRSVAEVFHAHQGRLIDKWEHYLPIYEKHFAKYVDTPVRVLEIGVSHGGSLQMWKEYFGPVCHITGVDIDPRCKDYEEPGIGVLIYDQNKLRAGDLGPFDIVIDDGSHVKEHQEASFKALWPDTRGVYLCEDIHGPEPKLEGIGGLVTRYPWVLVVERPKRMVTGKPSRPLNQDEIAAYGKLG